jgi:hypothetical protein
MTPVPVPLLDLTDEELAALDGAPDGLVVSPYLDELEPAARDQAILTAFRSLVARGVVEGPTADQVRQAVRAAAGAELTPVDVRMSEPLSQALTLRRVAPLVLCAQRTNAELSSWRYVHVVDDELALDEVVEPSGLHRFGLLRPADVPDVVLDWLAPDGWDGEDGPAQQLDGASSAPDVLLERLGAAVVVADVVVRRAGDEGGDLLIGTFAGPGLLALSTTRSGDAAGVSLRPASRRTVRAVIAEQLETP